MKATPTQLSNPPKDQDVKLNVPVDLTEKPVDEKRQDVNIGIDAAEAPAEGGKTNKEQNQFVMTVKPPRTFTEEEAEYLKLALFVEYMDLFQLGTGRRVGLAFLILLLLLFTIGSALLLGLCLGRTPALCAASSLD